MIYLTILYVEKEAKKDMKKRKKYTEKWNENMHVFREYVGNSVHFHRCLRKYEWQFKNLAAGVIETEINITF